MKISKLPTLFGEEYGERALVALEAKLIADSSKYVFRDALIRDALIREALNQVLSATFGSVSLLGFPFEVYRHVKYVSVWLKYSIIFPLFNL